MPKRCKDYSNTIGIFWHGRPWTKLERAAVNSWMSNYYDIEVFSYHPIENISDNVLNTDAKTVWNIDPSTINKHVKMHSYAPFADIFGYKMLEKCDGIIKACTDQFCLKRLPEDGLIFGRHSKDMIADAVLRIPARSSVGKHIFYYASYYEEEYYRLPWGTTGPLLMKEAVFNSNMMDYALPEKAFCPISPAEKLNTFYDLSFSPLLDSFDADPEVLGIQIYATGVLNSVAGNLDVFNNPVKDTLYARLLDRFL